jgi:hypothetical protein
MAWALRHLLLDPEAGFPSLENEIQKGPRYHYFLLPNQFILVLNIADAQVHILAN